MRKLVTLLSLCLTAACGMTHAQIQDDTQRPLLPFSLQDSLVYKRGFTPKAEESFIYLALDEAIRSADFEKVVEASNALLTINPNDQAIGDAASWLLSNGYLKETRTLLESATKKLPNSLNVHVMLAETILIQDENKQDSIKVLRDYITRNPTDNASKMELALAHLKINQEEEAYKIFQALPKSEKTPTVYYYMGFSLRKMGKLDEAAQALKQALQGSPDFMEAILELAQIEDERKNYAAARKLYEKILTFDVYNQDVLLRLVNLLLKEGKTQEAIDFAFDSSDSFSFVIKVSAMLLEEERVDTVEALMKKIATKENLPRDFIYLQGAVAFEGLKNSQQALYYLNQVQPTDKFYKNSLELKTQIYLDKDEYEKTIAVLQEAQSAFADDSQFLDLEYQIHLFQGNYSKALVPLEKYLEINPKDYEAIFKYGYIHTKIGQNAKAMSIMYDLIKKDPENHEALNYIGFSLVEEGKKLKYALELIQKANELNPNADYITDSLAWAYYKLKDYQKAWQYITKAVGLIDASLPQDSSMWDHYGDIAFALGKIPQAKEGWVRALDIKDDPKIREKLQKIQ